MQFSEFKELELTARVMLQWKVVREKLRWFEAAVQDSAASSQSKAECWQGVGDTDDKKEKFGSRGGSGGEGSS